MAWRKFDTSTASEVTGVAEHGRRATIADVAASAGVSRTTVSHALNGLGRVDPKTRQRVHAVAEELGYRPNLRAQRLRSGRSKVLGLFSSMPQAVAGGPSRLGFYMEIAAAAAETALTRGYALVLAPPLESGTPLESLDIDGAVVIEPERADPLTTQLTELGIPSVALGGQPGAALPTVAIDGTVIAELLLNHLYAEGARQIALLTGQRDRHSYVDVRKQYTQFVAEHDLPELSHTAPEDGGEAAGYAATKELLATHPGVDAVCATVDAFAVGAVRAVRDSGRSVPGDVLVATRYDGLRARTCDPPLTALDLHLDQLAANTVELLLAQLDGHPATVTTVDPPELRPRRSSVRP